MADVTIEADALVLASSSQTMSVQENAVHILPDPILLIANLHGYEIEPGAISVVPNTISAGVAALEAGLYSEVSLSMGSISLDSSPKNTDINPGEVVIGPMMIPLNSTIFTSTFSGSVSMPMTSLGIASNTSAFSWGGSVSIRTDSLSLESSPLFVSRLLGGVTLQVQNLVLDSSPPTLFYVNPQIPDPTSVAFNAINLQSAILGSVLVPGGAKAQLDMLVLASKARYLRYPASHRLVFDPLPVFIGKAGTALPVAVRAGILGVDFPEAIKTGSTTSDIPDSVASGVITTDRPRPV